MFFSTDFFGWQYKQETFPDNGGQGDAQAEELFETKLQTVSDFDEEFVPGTTCK